jgi:hypothetical protein
MTKSAKVKISAEGKIYDSDGFWLRAAAVCVRDDSESEVITFTSRQLKMHKQTVRAIKNCRRCKNSRCGCKKQ